MLSFKREDIDIYGKMCNTVMLNEPKTVDIKSKDFRNLLGNLRQTSRILLKIRDIRERMYSL